LKLAYPSQPVGLAALDQRHDFLWYVAGPLGQPSVGLANTRLGQQIIIAEAFLHLRQPALKTGVSVHPGSEAMPFPNKCFVCNLSTVMVLDRIVVHYDEASISQGFNGRPIQA